MFSVLNEILKYLLCSNKYCDLDILINAFIKVKKEN